MYLRQLISLPSENAAAVAEEMWQLLEPAPPLSFGQLDRHLLRLTVEDALRNTYSKRVLRDPVQVERLMQQMFLDMPRAPSGLPNLWTEFLLRSTASNETADPKIIDLGRTVRQVTDPDHHVAVMARALLLLRVASGATRKMLTDSGIGFEHLEFWWHPYGVGRGLWDIPPMASELTDGWADFSEALEDLRNWLDESTASNASYRSLLANVPQTMTTLTNMELVGLWSLAS
jgi:hypothetical protein